jgi:hypothetical protein
MPIFNVVERLTLASSALLLYPQKSCACTTILFTALKNPQWMVSVGKTTYSPTLLSNTCVSLSQHGLCGADEGQMHCAPHCSRKDTPFSLGGGPVSLPVGTSVMTTLLGFPLCQRVVTVPFCCSNATNCSGGCFLPTDYGMGGSSDVEGAALEVFFFDPATLDFGLAIVGLFLCMLRLVLSPTPTDKLVSKPSPSPLAPFSEGFFPLFLVWATLGMMSQ